MQRFTAKDLQQELKRKTSKIAPDEKFVLEERIRQLAAQLKQTLSSKHRNKDFQEFIADCSKQARKVTTPRWMKPKGIPHPKSIFVAALSDVHREETVDPEVMNYANGYDIHISDKRLELFFINICRTAFDSLKGFNFEGLVMPFIGDFVTGWIHEELMRTNAESPMQAVLGILAPLSAGIRLVAKEFKNVFIPCVIGNHSRYTKKVTHKEPVDSSFDWLIYALLAREFETDERVTFLIPRSTDAFFPIYSKRFALEHGNLLKGGTNAISGIFPSVSLGNYRKRNAEQSVDNFFDYLLIGDKHQLKFLGQVIINGSVIGYNEFARDLKFGFEPPQQFCFVVDPEHGITLKGEIHVQGKNEPWMLEGSSRKQAALGRLT